MLNDHEAALKFRLTAAQIAQLTTMIEEARATHPSALSPDHRQFLIYGDVGGAFYLGTDGDVQGEVWDDPSGPTSTPDEAFLIVAILAFADRYPEFRSLLPHRGPSSVDCVDCNATGRILIGEIRIFCGTCRGLGWGPLPSRGPAWPLRVE